MGGGGERCIKGFCRKPKRKRLHGRLRCMWEYYIAMHVKEFSWECVYWIYLNQHRDKWRVLVEQLSSHWHLKKDFTPWSYLWMQEH
jgi:hypothetical protein